MTDTMKRIAVHLGPYAGQSLDVPSDVAEQAISDGWAKDPFAPEAPASEAKEMSQEQRQKSIQAAEKAARKLRGEPEGPADEQPHQQKNMSSQTQGGQSYSTRDAQAQQGKAKK